MGEEAILPLRLFTNKTVGGLDRLGLIGMSRCSVAWPRCRSTCRSSRARRHRGRAAAAADDPRHHDRLDPVRPDHLAHRPLPPSSRSSVRPCSTISLFIFHYVAYDTPLWQTMIVMVLFGVGLGFNFQPLTLAVQNAVPPREIGVATSSATFTRQIGGTLGTAIFLSILFSSAKDKIGEAFRVLAPRPTSRPRCAHRSATRQPTRRSSRR
jgi:hypothetical protein